jgi:hypothetical protein
MRPEKVNVLLVKAPPENWFAFTFKSMHLPSLVTEKCLRLRPSLSGSSFVI